MEQEIQALGILHAQEGSFDFSGMQRMTQRFELPKLPPGWKWDKLPPMVPNNNGVYRIVVRASSILPGNQYVQEMIELTLGRDQPAEILRLFQAVCDKIVLRIIEVQSRPVQKNIDLLTDIYQVFNGEIMSVGVPNKKAGRLDREIPPDDTQSMESDDEDDWG